MNFVLHRVGTIVQKGRKMLVTSIFSFCLSVSKFYSTGLFTFILLFAIYYVHPVLAEHSATFIILPQRNKSFPGYTVCLSVCVFVCPSVYKILVSVQTLEVVLHHTEF